MKLTPEDAKAAVSHMNVDSVAEYIEQVLDRDLDDEEFSRLTDEIADSALAVVTEMDFRV